MSSLFEKIEFPQYRMYKNGKSYFKLISAEEFEEVQLIGSKKSVTQHRAKILPDRNFIYDLLLAYENFAQKITPEVYENIKKD